MKNMTYLLVFLLTLGGAPLVANAVFTEGEIEITTEADYENFDEAIEEVDEALEEMDETTQSLREFLVAPDACQSESTSDLEFEFDESIKDKSKGKIKAACKKDKFHAYICDANREHARKRRLDLGAAVYSRYEIEAAISKWPKNDSYGRDRMRKAHSDFSNAIDEALKNKTAAVPSFKDILNAAGEAEQVYADFETLIGDKPVREATFKTKEIAAQYDSAERVFIQLKNGLEKYLDDQGSTIKAQLVATLKADPKYRDMKKLEFDRFVLDAFDVMRQAVKKTVFDKSAPAHLCVRDQSNVFTLRTPGKPNRVVVCPGSVLPSIEANLGALTGALSKALAHSIDSCALDFMAVGKAANKEGDPVRLSGLLEPLRRCMGAKVGPQRALPAWSNSVPVPDSKLYEKSMGEAVQSGKVFATMPMPGGHCPKPMTAADLSYPEYSLQRDQSNDAVAQFFANKALANSLVKAADGSAGIVATFKGNQKDADVMRNVYAPFCDGSPTAKGPRVDPKILLNKIVMADADVRKLFCGKRDGEQNKLKKEITKVTKSYFTKKKLNADAPDPVKVRACDGAFAGGVAKYAEGIAPLIKMGYEFPTTGFEQAQQNAIIASGAPRDLAEAPVGVDVAVLAGGDAGQDSSGAQGVSGNEGDATLGVAVGDPTTVADVVAPPEPVAEPEIDDPNVIDLVKYIPDRDERIATIAARAADREAALASIREKCSAAIEETDFPPYIDEIQMACANSPEAKKSMRLDVDLWGSDEIVSSDMALNYVAGCQARCSCDTNECLLPEVVYRGAQEPPKLIGANDADFRQADIDFLMYQDPPQRFGIAHKSCYLKAPDRGILNDGKVAECNGASENLVYANRGEKVSFIGELSGAVIDFECNFTCFCDGSRRCLAIAVPPDVSKSEFRLADAEARKSIDAQYAGQSPVILSEIRAPAAATQTSKAAPVPAQGPAPDVAPDAVDVNVDVEMGGSEPLYDDEAGFDSASSSSSEVRGSSVHPLDYDFTYTRNPGLSQSDPSFKIRYDNRNILRKSSEKIALKQCIGIAEKMRAAGQKPDQKKTYRYMQNSYAFGDKPVKTPKIQGGLGEEYEFEFQCLFNPQKSCSEPGKFGGCVEVAYVGPGPEKIYWGNGASYQPIEGWASDWGLQKKWADKFCVDQPKKGKEFALTSPSCSAKADNEGPTTDKRTYFTKYPGDLTEARLPFYCHYECDCKDLSCKGATAMPLKLKGDLKADTYKKYADAWVQARNEKRAAKKRKEAVTKAEAEVKRSGLKARVKELCDSPSQLSAQIVQGGKTQAEFNQTFSACIKAGKWDPSYAGSVKLTADFKKEIDGQKLKLSCQYSCGCGGPELSGLDPKAVKGSLACSFLESKSEISEASR